MTVKEIFELRKQGRIEEAYETIRPMYAAHRGRYTTLCMFWTAADVFKLRLDQGRTDEAAKILEALKRILPNVEAVNKELDTQAAAKATSTPAATSDKLPWEHDKPQQEGSSASAFIASATRRLAKIKKTSIVTNKSSINEKLTSNSRQLTSKEEASPSGNICDIRAICETEIKVLSDANQSNPSNPCSTADSSDSCSPIPINEQLTANSRQLMLKEKAPKGNNLRDSQDFVSASEQATNNNSEEFAAYGTCLSKQINEELTANSRQLMLKEKAPKGNNLRDSQDFVSASEQATKESLQGKEDKTINSQLLHDYPGHLTVSLEDGIIRPIPGINAPQRIVLACITAHPGYSVPQISASTGIPAKSIERHVAALIDKNLIGHRGSKKTGGYHAL